MHEPVGQEKEKKTSVKKELLSWLRVLASSILLALIITNFFIVNASVLTGSMENTIMTGDRVLGSRLSYIRNGPERYDVVIFRYPDSDENINYVKRIIGLPGEKVQIIDGMVYIDDAEEPLYDGFTHEPPEGDHGPFYVPEDHYFLLGDNRNNSFDSKDWETHFVARDKILGKMMFVYYPKLHWVDKAEAE